MDYSSFCNEINQYIGKIQHDFRETQNIMKKTLDEFHRVCKLNHIEYQLAYGTLLGAVRDNGQIPWDYDVDVIVKYADRDKLVAALNKDLSSEYYVDAIEYDIKCESFKLRVSPKVCDISHYHLDVFLLIPAPEDEVAYKKMSARLVRLSKLRRYKVGKGYPISRRLSMEIWMKTVLGKLICCFLPLKLIDFFYHKEVEKALKINSNYYMMADIWASSWRFPKQAIDRIEEKDFLFGKYNIPEDYDTVLTIRYGDYRTYADISSRFNEWMNGCRVLGLLNK